LAEALKLPVKFAIGGTKEPFDFLSHYFMGSAGAHSFFKEMPARIVNLISSEKAYF